MKRTLILFALLLCVAAPVVAQQSGYGGDGKAASGATVSSFIRLYETPPTAATLAAGAAGTTTTGAHIVKVTCYSSSGETTGGTASSSVDTATAQFSISAIPLCSSVATGRRVYMNTVAAPTVYNRVSNGQIANNTATTLTVTDNDATIAGGAAVPTSNTMLDTRLTVGQDAITLAVPLTSTSTVLTSGNLINFASTSTLAASNTQTVLNVATSGANGTASQTTYAANFSNTHTGAGTNVAAKFTASGGSTNYAALMSGSVKLTDGFSTAAIGGLVYTNNTGYVFIGPESGSSTNGAALTVVGASNTDNGGTTNGALLVNVNTTNAFMFTSTGLRANSANLFGFTTGTASGGTLDTAIARNAAGVIEADLGTPGTNGWFQNRGGEGALTAAFTKANATLGATNLSYTLIAGRAYRIKGLLQVSNTVAAEGVQFAFDGGTATATTFFVSATAVSGAVVAGTTSATALATPLTFTTTTGTCYIAIDAYILVNAGGTFILRAAESTTATGTVTIGIGSWLALDDTVLK